MDYDYPLDGSPAVTPRNYRWTSALARQAKRNMALLVQEQIWKVLFMVMVLMNMALLFDIYFRGYSSYGSTHKATR